MPVKHGYDKTRSNARKTKREGAKADLKKNKGKPATKADILAALYGE